MDWRWFQPGFISPVTQVRILPLRLRGGLEMVPAGPHKPCNVGSNPTPATHRDVAQVVARVIWDHEAAGSSPVIPT